MTGDAVEPELSPEEISRMAIPTWEQAKAAMAEGEVGRASELIDRAAGQWRSLQDYSINWITSLLSFIGRELGEEAVERALRVTGEEFVRPRRDTGVAWASLPASARAKVIARAMVANLGSVEVDEDEEKITLSFRCGSGGRIFEEGRYDEQGGTYLTLTERSGRTFGRDRLPVYCAHCSVNNEMQSIEWTGYPTSVEHPPHRPGEPCVHHVYKDPDATPASDYGRVGKEPPTGTGVSSG